MSDKPYVIEDDVPYYIIAPRRGFLRDDPWIADSIYYPGQFEGGAVHQRIIAAPDNYEYEFDEGGMRIWATSRQIHAKNMSDKAYDDDKRRRYEEYRPSGKRAR